MKSYIYGLLFKNKNLKTNKIKNKTIIKPKIIESKTIKLKKEK